VNPGAGPHDDDEPPPILGTWKRLYTAVLVYLFGLIVLFYWFREAFTP
jgi:hypothetical protein